MCVYVCVCMCDARRPSLFFSLPNFLFQQVFHQSGEDKLKKTWVWLSFKNLLLRRFITNRPLLPQAVAISVAISRNRWFRSWVLGEVSLRTGKVANGSNWILTHSLQICRTPVSLVESSSWGLINTEARLDQGYHSSDRNKRQKKIKKKWVCK